MTNEFGVACLLDQASAEELAALIPFLDLENLPHISLFQFKSCDPDFLSLMHEFVGHLRVSTYFLTTHMSLVDGNVFLNIADDYTLKKASNQLAALYATRCPTKEYLSQIDFNELSVEQMALVKHYGIHWVKQHYQPHVTVSYERQVGRLDNSLPVSVKILQPEIYLIDSLGRIARDAFFTPSVTSRLQLYFRR